MKYVVDDTTRSHETWIDGTTYDSAQRVPGRGIEPIPKLL